MRTPLIVVLAAVTFSGCYVGVNTRVGRRTYPSPDGTALLDAPAGPNVRLPRLVGSASVSVCEPEMEASGPSGLRFQDGHAAGFVPPDDEQRSQTLVQGAFLSALSHAGVSVVAVGSHCEVGGSDAPGTPFFVRSEITDMEHDVHELSRATGHQEVAVGLEVDLYRHDGTLVFRGLYAGEARAGLREASSDALTRVSVGRLVADLLRGRFGRALHGS